MVKTGDPHDSMETKRCITGRTWIKIDRLVDEDFISILAVESLVHVKDTGLASLTCIPQEGCPMLTARRLASPP